MGNLTPACDDFNPSALSYKTRKRLIVFERDGWLCAYCGRLCKKFSFNGKPQGRSATLDHVVPKSRGGSNALSNLVTACMACNTQKHNRTLDEYLFWKCGRVDSEETRL